MRARSGWFGRHTAAAMRRAARPIDRARRFVAREVLVVLPSTLPPREVEELARRHRLTQLDSHGVEITGTTLHRWRIHDRRSIADVIRAIEAEGGPGTAQPNHVYSLQ